MFRKQLLLICGFVLILAAIGIAAAEESVIYMSQTTPYSDSNNIAKKILDDCNLPQSLADFIVECAKENGFTIKKDDKAVKAGKGRILFVYITNAYSYGHAGLGHSKSVNVQGKLMENGKEIGNFTGFRASGGGFAGRFKGSCTVLNRCCKALADDIADWLKNPSQTSRIGQ